MTKVLVLGRMPANANPETHIAAGPWCFAGAEQENPGWEKRFEFAPEPLANSGRLLQASRLARALCLKMVPSLADCLCADARLFPPVYWQTILAPWAIAVSRLLITRGLYVKAMTEKWGGQPLCVGVLPEDAEFGFANEHDFTWRGVLGLDFNTWIFSRILENHWPAPWRKKILPAPQRHSAPDSGTGGMGGKVRSLAAMALRMLPFPRLKGLTTAQALLFSTALLHRCKQPDHSGDPEQDFRDTDISIPLPASTDAVFIRAMPDSLRNLRHKAVRSKASGAVLRVASVTAYEDSAYRQALARWRAKGNRLAFCQHGANYGQVRTVCDISLVEYVQDTFFTWGWTRHGNIKGNFVPMPYPQLARIANKWLPKSQRLLLVGTEMGTLGHRLDSQPTPMQMVRYRQDRLDFLNLLPPEPQGQILYRPYFPVPGTLSDWPWLHERVPSLQLCTGPLLPHLLGCSALVLDHPGTTMLEAFAANTPLLLFWDRDSWPMTREADDMFDLLAECGIWHSSPSGAARALADIWPRFQSWWATKKIQNARLGFCHDFARLPDGSLNHVWLKTLWGL